MAFSYLKKYLTRQKKFSLRVVGNGSGTSVASSLVFPARFTSKISDVNKTHLAPQ